MLVPSMATSLKPFHNLGLREYMCPRSKLLSSRKNSGRILYLAAENAAAVSGLFPNRGSMVEMLNCTDSLKRWRMDETTTGNVKPDWRVKSLLLTLNLLTDCGLCIKSKTFFRSPVVGLPVWGFILCHSFILFNNNLAK